MNTFSYGVPGIDSYGVPVFDQQILFTDYDKYGLPLDVRYELDPAYVEATNDIVYDYVSPNGKISVKIVGTIAHVMSIKRVLDTANPTLDIKPSEEFVPITDVSRTSSQISADKISYTSNGNHLIVEMNGKKFSGSGIVIFIADKTNPNEWNIALFRSQHNDTYEECGGRIDKKTTITDPPNFLFNNASKEFNEESALLFNTTTKSDWTVDILSTETQSTYRVFCYLIRIDHMKDLPQLFVNNLRIVYRNGNTFGEDYREMTDMKLFDKNILVATIKREEKILSNVSSYSMRSIDGKISKIRGRTINILLAITRAGGFDTFLQRPVKDVTIQTSLVNSENLTTINI